ncbi:MAG: amino acid adenylation domain-containing protein, partial [Vicinamibacterales bacterium]
MRASGDGAYVEQFTSAFEGDLEVDLLREAWQRVVDRHDQLRAAFVWRDADEPAQIVLRGVTIPWEADDWSGVRPDEQRRRLDAWLADERARGFDLAVAPAMRFSLIRLAARVHQFTWTFHHILLDGWSVQIVLRDVAAEFEALRERRPSTTAPAPPYRGYLAWLGEQDREAAEHFWRRQLEGLNEPTALRLPLPESPSPSYADHWIELSDALTDRLAAVGRRHQLTMGSIVAGAWAALLGQYTSQSDVVFGVTGSGRPPDLPGVASMVGLFINTLPMRVQLSPRETLLTLLQQVQARQLAMRDFEYAPLTDVQRWADLAGGDALFDTMLAFENYPIERVVDGGRRELIVRDVRIIEQTHYPLTVVIVPGPPLRVRIGYDERKYDAETIGRMGRQLHRIFAQIGADVSAAIAASTGVAEDEALRIAAFSSGRRGGYEADATIPGMFARCASASPDAIALSAGGVHLTYAELDRQSARIARYLRRHGVGPDVPVGICFDGGLDVIVCLLGVLKAGGAYLALDPSYPMARLALMVAEAGAPMVLTDGARAARFETPAAVVDFDAERDAIAAESIEAVDPGVTPDHLAYICYTSGSTGMPKGVAVTQRGVIRLLFGADFATLGPQNTWLQLAPVPFDASTLEIWGALLHGGRLVLTADRTPTPQTLGALLSAERVTSLWLTASLFNTIVDVAPEVLAGVRQLLVGGEALSVAHVRRGLAALPDTQIINGYGPTESTTFACCYPIPSASGSAARPIPIGRPIANTTVHVLDPHVNPVPVGVPGELYIGGDGLARGYMSQPARTAERFIPDPFSDRPGRRMYRTGDLVRWTSEGVVDFLGRNDSQVKIRGFRIEPGEIEAALEAHPAVKAAAVIGRQDRAVKRLVAYVVSAGGASTDEEALRQHLRLRLPEYMMPATFVTLDRLPLTRNGKIDRDALPEPEAAGGKATRAPQTEAEVAIAAIWSDVLRSDEVGADSNFFELGGDSILGIQICARAQRAGWHVTPKQLFEHQTVAGLASVARRPGAAKTVTPEASGSAPLLPIQRWFFEQDLADAHHFTQAVLLTVKSGVTAHVIEQALAALLAHHDGLRVRFTKSGDGWSARIESAAAIRGVLNRITLPEDQAAAPASAIERAAASLHASLDLEQGPLVRATLFEGLRHHRLLIVIHPLGVDTVSWRILLEDLDTACRQATAGHEITLPARTTSVRQWGERLAAHADA